MRIIVTVERRTGRGHMIVRVPSLSSVSTYLVGSIEAREEALRLVVRSVRPSRLEIPNRVLIVQDSTDRSEAKVFRAHAPPHGTQALGESEDGR